MKKEYKSKRIKASMTVEASLILPIFIMLFMNLLSMIEVYRIHSNVAATLWEEGRKTAKYLYLKETAAEVFEGADEIDVSKLEALLTSISGQRQIIENLETYPVWERIVTGGKGGFAVVGKSEENGILSIDCSYRIHPLFVSFTPVSKKIENHYYGHAWIGYVLGEKAEEGADEEIFVYITETGTVYHKNRGCSYLNPSIQNIGAGELESIRNKSGGIYYPCPLCDDIVVSGGTFYITDYGTDYHTSAACSGLKRTIYTVRLSEVKGRGACSKCGGS